MRDVISYYFFLLFVYSFVGWVWESVFCSLYVHHRLINRGFLNGPYCPIYGTGAVFSLITLSAIDNPVALFFASAVLTCSLEYFTSWAMEKLFHARWWDYSDHKLNINGRVYYGGFIAFGTGIVLLIKVINPFVTKLVLRIPYDVFNGVCALLFTTVVVDFAITLSGLSGMSEKLRDLTAALDVLKDNMADRLDVVRDNMADRLDIVKDSVTDHLDTVKDSVTDRIDAVTDKIQSSAPYGKAAELYERFSDMLTAQQKRIIHAFPTLKSVNYAGVFSELKKYTLLQRSKTEKK